MSNRRAQDERIEGTPDGVNAITEIVDVPDAPTIGTATAGIGNASVPFTAATTGGTVSTFTAISNPGSFTGTSATSPITVSGLAAGTSYSFTVRGTNSTGTGAYSSASNSVTALSTPGSYDALADITLSETASSIKFSGIPSGYKHLQIRMLARTTAAGNNYSTIITANNDTTYTNYRSHYIYGLGSGTPTAGTYQSENGFYPTNSVAGAGAGDNVFAASIIDLLDYENITTYKTLKALTGQDRNGSGIVQLSSALWMSTAAITSLTFTVAGGDYATYSQIALYGVK